MTVHGDMPGEVIVVPADFERRVIEPSQFVADEQAFVDVRLPRSRGKASYSLIGPGVSQNAGQSINLKEPHGYNIGAASMPAGTVNSQHLHYTAEVFICTRGCWKMNIGEHNEQSLTVSVGDVFATPTWVFRGFENIGGDDGWLFTVLGGNDTGGIIWAPQVLKAAATTGLYLGPDQSVIEANGSGPPEEYLSPLSADDLTAIDHYSDQELAERLVRRSDVNWNERALLSSVLLGHETAVAPIIGYGMTEFRGHRAPVTVSHGFSLEWLRIGPGAETGLHRHDDTQVLFIIDGDFEVHVNRDPNRLTATPAPESVVSVPPAAWRNFVNRGTVDAHAIVVNGGDNRTLLEWDPSIVDAAKRLGFGRDASSFLAPLALLARGGL